jgi:hypothetical protein
MSLSRSFFAVTLFASSASAKLDTGAFLASAQSAPIVQMRAKSRMAMEAPAVLNPIDRLQFVYEFATDKNEREYGVKFVPRGITEYRLDRRLRGQQWLIEDLALRREIGKALESRYLALIEHAHAGSRAKLQRELLKLAEREVAVVAKSTRALQSEAKDLMKVREGYLNSRMLVSQAEMTLSATANLVKSYDPMLKDDQIHIDDLVTPVEAAKILEKNSKRGLETSLDVQLARESSKMAHNEYAYGIARSGRLLDSVALTMEQKKDENRYTVQFAINIPGFAGNDFSARDKAQKVLWAEIEARETESAFAKTAGAIRLAFDKSLESYRLFSGHANGSSKTLNERMKKLAQRQDPLLLLAIEKAELEEKLRLVDATAESLKMFVQFLSIEGVLAENPKANFLSRGTGGES